jgi:glutaredoxin-like protein NrdH
MNHIKGINKGDVMLYALSTCGWCKKTKQLLNDLGVDYKCEDVDLLDKNEYEHVKREIAKWNPSISFPTIVINNEKCILGFDEEQIKKELG